MKHSNLKGARTSVRGRLALTVALGALVLAGCGGSDDDVAADPRDAQGGQVSSQAAVSGSAFVSYLRTLATSDTDEPLRLDGFIAPVDDTGDAT